MDVIASVAFGTQIDSQNNPDDPFVRHAQLFFSFSFFRPLMLFFSMFYNFITFEFICSSIIFMTDILPFFATVAFPKIMAPIARFIPNKRRDQMNGFFISIIQKIIQQREEQPPSQVGISSCATNGGLGNFHGVFMSHQPHLGYFFVEDEKISASFCWELEGDIFLLLKSKNIPKIYVCYP